MNTPANVYYAFKDDESAIADLRRKQKELAMICCDPQQAMAVTSFTMNGQSAAGVRNETNAQLLDRITAVLAMIDEGAAIQTSVTGVQF